MTVMETYPIHRCIFRNDYEGLKELLLDKDMKKRINEKDNHGNTPIHLAFMLDRRNCIIILINNGCDVITRNNFKWNPTDEALMLGDVDIIERISKIKAQECVKCFTRQIKRWTEEIPNFYMKYKIKLKSPLPLFEILGAKDKLEIIKKGNSLRINTTFAGIENKNVFRLIKGNMSILFKYDESNDSHKIYILDNIKKNYQEIYPNIPQWMINDTIKTKIGVNSLYKYFFDPTTFSMKQKKPKFLRKNKTVITTESGKSYETDKYKCIVTLISRSRNNETVIGDYESEINTNVLLTTADNPSGIVDKKHDDEKDDEDIDDNDNETESDSDDDSGNDTIIINENINDQMDDKKIEHSIFEKYINEKTIVNGDISKENREQIIHILDNGHDDDGNNVSLNDIKYIEQHLPNCFGEIIKEKLSHRKVNDRFRYMRILKKVSDERVNYKLDKDGKTNIYKLSSKSNSLDLESAFNKYKEIIEEERNKKMEEKNIREKLNKRKKITEEEYFDPSNTNIMHIGRIMNINEERKNMNNIATFYLSKRKQFPINLTQMLPFINFLHMIAYDQINTEALQDDPNRIKYFEVIENCIKVLEAHERFPIKIVHPIYPTLKLVVKLLECYIDEEKIPENLFSVPEDFTYDTYTVFKNIN